MKLGLENIGKLLVDLGEPQKKYLKVQVAGTNGKGSVCAFLSSICINAGIRTGMFTSPHLISITERVKIDGTDIGEETFARLATRVRERSERLAAIGEIEGVPTYFEQVTAIALLAFAEAGVDLAILETGLGGRLDATTAAGAEICAITRIDIDHQQCLGETIEEIAAEKAAIIHARSRVAIGEQGPNAMAVLLERCRMLGILPRLASQVRTEIGEHRTGRDRAKVRSAATPDTGSAAAQLGTTSFLLRSGPPVSFTTEGSRYADVLLGIRGRHQTENARIAIILAEMLRDDLSISDQNVVDGLETARHPGRLELAGRYLLDGAHNTGGARALAAYLAEFVEKPITLIFGVMKDKDVREIFLPLIEHAESVIFTRPDNERAVDPNELPKVVPSGFDQERVFIAASVADALARAREVAPPQAVILITGSLYLVGEARRSLTHG